MLGIMGPHYKLGDHRLDETGRLLGRSLGDAKQSFTKIRLGGYPPKAATGSDGLGKRIETDHTALVIDRKVARDEGIKKLISRGLLRFRGVQVKVI